MSRSTLPRTRLTVADFADQAAAILAARRAHFGGIDFRMDATGGDGGSTGGDAGAGGDGGQNGADGGATGQGGDGGQQNQNSNQNGDQGQQGDQTFDAKYVQGLRDEAAKYRTQLRDAQTAQQTQLDAIAVALGLKKDGDQAPDPAQLTEQLTAAQAQARQNALQLAVFQNAAAAGADPSRLLDSNSFLTAVKDIDPTDGQAIQAAIKTAADQNQWLKAGRAPGASGADHTGGSGDTSATFRKPTSMHDAVAQSYATT